MDPDRFASQALARVAANRAIIIVPARWRIAWWLYRLSPSLAMTLSRKVHESTMRKMAGTGKGARA
jgi:short-subunit dehydrogenase